MQAPTTSNWRLLRGGVFALLATQLAAMAHAAGGGELPDLSVLLTVAVFVGGSVAALATRRWTWPWIWTALAASQLVFHLVFLVTAHHPGSIEGGRMLVFHLLCVAVTAWVLSGGESALFRLYRVLRRWILPMRIGTPVHLAPSWTVLIWLGAGLRLGLDGALTGHRRRGPPVYA